LGFNLGYIANIGFGFELRVAVDAFEKLAMQYSK
jgi:hypothetical protein